MYFGAAPSSQSIWDTISSFGGDVYSMISSTISEVGASITDVYNQAANWSQSKTDETHQLFVDTVNRRKKLWEAINSLPEGTNKQNLLDQFNGYESYLTNALFPLGNKFYELVGYSPIDTTLGALPLIPLAVVGAACLVGLYWISRNYDALEKNPALADTGIQGGIAKGVNSAIFLVGLAVAAAIVFPLVKEKLDKIGAKK